MRSRVLVAVLMLGLGAVGGACMYGRQKDKSVQDDFVDISRLPASEKEFEELNAIIYGITKAEDVRPAIERIHGIAVNQPKNDAAKVYDSILHPMVNMEGIVYRMRFMVEKMDVAYIQSISALRAFKRNSGRRAPHVDAFFDYFTHPNPDQVVGTQKGPFRSVAQFQDWMAGTVFTEIGKSLVTLRDVADRYKANPTQAVFYYDIGLVVGQGSAGRAYQGSDQIPSTSASQTRRLRRVVAEDIYALVADMEERVGMGHYLASYDLEDLPRFVNSLTSRTFLAKKAKFSVLPGQTAFDIHLQSPKEFHEELTRFSAKDELDAILKARFGSKLKSAVSAAKEKYAYAHFLTLRDVGKAKYLDQAREHIIKAIEARTSAMTLAKGNARSANRQDFFIDPDTFTSRPGFTENILAKRLRELASSQAIPYTDRVTGEPFQLNVFAMLDKNNPKIRDLKAFFPDNFAGGSETDGKDSVHFAWNYDYGKPTHWPDATFGGVLPDTTSQNFPDRLASLSRDASTRVLQMWLRLYML